MSFFSRRHSCSKRSSLQAACKPPAATAQSHRGTLQSGHPALRDCHRNSLMSSGPAAALSPSTKSSKKSVGPPRLLLAAKLANCLFIVIRATEMQIIDASLIMTWQASYSSSLPARNTPGSKPLDGPAKAAWRLYKATPPKCKPH